MFDGNENLYNCHSTYPYSTKTLLFSNIIHLIQKNRNDLLYEKKFVFPSFQFDFSHNATDVPDNFISWHIFHEVYERDGKLQGHFKKALKLPYQITYPDNNKQSVQN